MTLILADEATTTDVLDRGAVVEALATVAQTCHTPFVIGVYGDWGSGKTSLLQMVRRQLGPARVQCVWFDAWLHQDDDQPAIALLQTMIVQFDLGAEGRKLLMVIASAFAGSLMKATTGIAIKDVQALGEAYENERFQQRDVRIRLREHFKTLVDKVRGPDKRRVVFIIDDLDRCQPEAALRMLEALRLYLNIPGCVFMLATDKGALLRAIAKRYGEQERITAQYLDKVIQLPFYIPFPPQACLRAFTAALLPPEMSACLDFIDSGIGGNPRSIKRFINVLILCSNLARKRGIPDFDPVVLSFILLLQYHDYERFVLAAAEPSALSVMLQARAKEPNQFLKAAMRHIKTLPHNVADYIHLTDSTGVATALDDTYDDGHKPDDSGEPAAPVIRQQTGTRARKKPARVPPGPRHPARSGTKGAGGYRSMRRPNSAFMRPVSPDSELAAVVGPQAMPRTELTKKLWAYIKKNGLQDRKTKTQINADATLKTIFGGRNKVSMFEMTKLLSKHVT